MYWYFISRDGLFTIAPNYNIVVYETAGLRLSLQSIKSKWWYKLFNW